MNELVTFKLTKDAFYIVFDENIPFKMLKDLLIKKLEDAANFFDGVKLKTILKGRSFSKSEVMEIKNILYESIGFEEVEEEKINYNAFWS